MSVRLDRYLFEQGLAPSGQQARALIMAGAVFVDNQKADKAGMPVKDGQRVEVRGSGLPYVSRGGLKLEKAMQSFDITLQESVCADIGASTGGFTDCMLQNGARRVYAVDVGYGQLAWKLRTDPRVVNLERTNFRYVTTQQIPEPLDFASVDVSFISLTLILPVLSGLIRPGGQAVCLIKPQFEAGREHVGKKGVVRDAQVHIDVISKIVDFALETGWSVRGLDYSPIKGPQGNIEYLIWLCWDGQKQNTAAISARELTERSHAALD